MSLFSQWTISTLSWNMPPKEIFQRLLLPYSGSQGTKNQIKAFFRTRTLGYIHTFGQCYEIFALNGYHSQRSQVREHFYNWTRKNQSRRFGNEQSDSWSDLTSLSKSGNTNILCSWDNPASTLFLPYWYLVLGMHILLSDFSLASLQRCYHLNSSLFRYLKRSQTDQRKLWRVFNQLHHFPSYKKSKNKAQHFRCKPHSKKQR